MGGAIYLLARSRLVGYYNNSVILSQRHPWPRCLPKCETYQKQRLKWCFTRILASEIRVKLFSSCERLFLPPFHFRYCNSIFLLLHLEFFHRTWCARFLRMFKGIGMSCAECLLLFILETFYNTCIHQNTPKYYSSLELKKKEENCGWLSCINIFWSKLDK